MAIAKATSKKTTTSKKGTNKLDAKNTAAAVQQVTSNRELKYVYPTDCKNPLERKAFRQKVRAALRKFEKEMQSLKGRELTAKRKEFKAYQSEVLA